MVNTELSSKRLELLKETAPQITRVAVFTDPSMGHKAFSKPPRRHARSASKFRSYS